MIKNQLYVVALLLLLAPNFLFPQSNSQKEKYWIYRERMKNFVVKGAAAQPGIGIPANSRDPDPNSPTIRWADSPWMMGYWIGTLAMEYSLLNYACVNGNTEACSYLERTKEDLFYAIDAINHIDCYAEAFWGGASCFDDCGTHNTVNGFMLRDDVSKNFPQNMIGNKSVADMMNESWVPPPDHYRLTCVSSAGADYYQGKNEASQDHLTGLYIGLALVKHLVPPTDSWDNHYFTDPEHEKKFVKEVQNISHRIITWLNSHAWIYWNKCENRGVHGVTLPVNPSSITCSPQSQDPCGSLCYIPTESGIIHDCCIEPGGAIAIPQAIGFASVNLFIQVGSPYYPEAYSIKQNLVYCCNTLPPPFNVDIYRDAWNVALSNPFPSIIPITLSALGDIGHIYKVPALPPLLYVYLEDGPRTVASNLVFYGVQESWEHLILLHRLLYGNQYTIFGNDLISISDNHYECLLDAAPCRGFDGQTISGANVEWGCTDRLDGSRACGDGGGDLVDSYNGMGYMFYYNLYHLVQFQSTTLPPNNFNPIPIKHLAQTNITKDGGYVEYDKKNFMASNSITASTYTVNSFLGEGQGRVVFAAGKVIDLLPGFETKNGGTLNAYIDPDISAAGCSTIPTNTNCISSLRSLPYDTSMVREYDTLFVQQILPNDSTLRSTYQRVDTTLQSAHINHNISITPNPTSGSFTISLKESTQGEVFIYNSLGQVVFQSAINNPQFAINLSSRPRGIYLIKVQSADGKIYTEKIVLWR